MIRRIHYSPMKRKGVKSWIVWCERQLPGAGYLIVRVEDSRLLSMCQFDWASGLRGSMGGDSER